VPIGNAAKSLFTISCPMAERGSGSGSRSGAPGCAHSTRGHRGPPQRKRLRRSELLHFPLGKGGASNPLAFLCAFAQSFEQLFVRRGLHGLGFGGEWATGAVLMGEAGNRDDVKPATQGRGLTRYSGRQ
jgi:MFS family permease